MYKLYIATHKYTQNSNTQNYEIVYYKTIIFWHTNIHTKYTKHYYLIKLKYIIRFWYTNIHTKIYKFIIKFSFCSYKLSY
jgi:hypothetical protein